MIEMCGGDKALLLPSGACAVLNGVSRLTAPTVSPVQLTVVYLQSIMTIACFHHIAICNTGGLVIQQRK